MKVKKGRRKKLQLFCDSIGYNYEQNDLNESQYAQNFTM